MVNVSERRAALLTRLSGYGPTGAVLGELLDWDPPAGHSDPVRWQRLMHGTARQDMHTLEAAGKVSRIGLRSLPWAANPAIVWAAVSPAPPGEGA